MRPGGGVTWVQRPGRPKLTRTYVQQLRQQRVGPDTLVLAPETPEPDAEPELAREPDAEVGRGGVLVPDVVLDALSIRVGEIRRPRRGIHGRRRAGAGGEVHDVRILERCGGMARPPAGGPVEAV